MDPVSFAVTLLALYGLFTRAPGLIAEALAEREYARRGEESPRAAARRRRLEEMGVDPAAGGPMRQYLGNWWRDFWQDLDRQRAVKRARRAWDLPPAAGDERPGWWQRLRDSVDAEVSRRATRWQRRRHDGNSVDADDSTTCSGPGAAAPDQGQPASGRQAGSPPDSGGSSHDTTPHREPIRVTAIVGDPTRNPPPAEQPATAITATTTEVIEGEVMTQAVATSSGEVTGVVSGAAEARAIQREIDHAVGEFVTRLHKVRARIQSLGEQTLGNVQLATNSQVIAATAQAAEAAAAAEASAKGCASEVGPQLGIVAKAFDRLNS